ncbi:MAG: transposase [Treponema sp.]|jgi:transposase InsO family protein|nr:transposase [Treponema sp.]
MYREYVERMNKAETASERKATIDEMCRMFAFSAAKAYKVLREAGWVSGRRKRTDAGTSSLAPENLDAVASVIRNGLRKNGKSTMPVNVARALLKSNGIDIPIGNSRLRQLLREASMTAENAKAPSPHTRMRSLCPNHVHFTDPSLSLLYFAPGGKQHILRDDEVYKNKPFLEGKEDLKCWRYVLTDHYSSSIYVRYYAAKGENAVNMYDFLLHAWGRKQTKDLIFHGIPRLLFWDKGSGNINKPTKNALAALRVETRTHEAGNPRAKGQVEGANNIVETHFECLLRLEEVHSIDELNDAAERWCAAYNSNSIEYLDTRLHRGGQIVGSRAFIWQRIRAEQLRELPDPEICRAIFTTGILTRKVAGDLTVSIVHPKTKMPMRYSVARLPGILIGQEVNLQPILVDPEPLVRASYLYGKDLVCQELEPIEYENIGFALDGAVIGEEYKKQKETARERNAKRLSAIAGESGIPFASITNGEGLKTHSLIQPDSPFIRQRTGEQVTVHQADRVETHEILLNHFEAYRRVSSRIGYVPDGLLDRLKSEYPQGVPVSAVDAVAKEFEAGTELRLSL